VEDEKINEMNDLERRSNASRVYGVHFVDQMRIGLQLAMSIILAAGAISFGLGK
jgi:hypothetical protein